MKAAPSQRQIGGRARGHGHSGGAAPAPLRPGGAVPTTTATAAGRDNKPKLSEHWAIKEATDFFKPLIQPIVKHAQLAAASAGAAAAVAVGAADPALAMPHAAAPPSPQPQPPSTAPSPGGFAFNERGQPVMELAFADTYDAAPLDAADLSKLPLAELVNALVANEQGIAALVNDEVVMDRLAGDDEVLQELARRRSTTAAVSARRVPLALL